MGRATRKTAVPLNGLSGNLVSSAVKTSYSTLQQYSYSLIGGTVLVDQTATLVRKWDSKQRTAESDGSLSGASENAASNDYISGVDVVVPEY